ncbi:uncharacterized protein DMAD_13601 [Drosophila madeirensis]|uniref:Uncharacterized protein n=1 Tax=Drosophila madeirensis TaxID=30013 RepID=A0AAU9FLG7_DROMD
MGLLLLMLAALLGEPFGIVFGHLLAIIGPKGQSKIDVAGVWTFDSSVVPLPGYQVVQLVPQVPAVSFHLV